MKRAQAQKYPDIGHETQTPCVLACIGDATSDLCMVVQIDAHSPKAAVLPLLQSTMYFGRIPMWTPLDGIAAKHACRAHVKDQSWLLLVVSLAAFSIS